jgi:hypothetical protein
MINDRDDVFGWVFHPAGGEGSVCFVNFHQPMSNQLRQLEQAKSISCDRWLIESGEVIYALGKGLQVDGLA